MPFPASTGKALPSLDLTDVSSLVPVRQGTEQTPVATGFQAHAFESKLDTLTDLMIKMSDTLSRHAQPSMAFLNSEDEEAL